MAEPFSIHEAITFGWHKTKAHSGVLFQGMLVLFGIEILRTILERTLGESIEGYFASALCTIVSFIIGAGFVRITMKLARNEHATYKDLVPPANLIWLYFLASILSGLLIVGGLILLIIPGIYLMLRFSFVHFYALDGVGVRESLRKSSVITKDIKWKLLGFFLVLIALNILGAIALLVGLLVSIPVSAIAYAHVYEKLKHRHHPAH